MARKVRRPSSSPHSRPAAHTPGQPPAHASGIDGLLSGLSTLLGTLGELAEKGQQLQRDATIKGPDGKDVSFHYGVSVRTLDGGKQLRVEPFGTMRTGPQARQAPVRELREPLTDVFEEDDHVLVVVEMPGLTRDDARFDLAGDVLTISGERGDKRYRKELLLPSDSLTMPTAGPRCNSGVFELRLSRTR